MDTKSQEWQPMATAPRDGTRIAVMPDGIFDRAEFFDGYWLWSNSEGSRFAAGVDPKGWRPVPVQQMGMAVFCRNASGQPDVYLTTLTVTQECIAAGDHYAAAMVDATANGYEPLMAADESDPAYRMISAAQQAPSGESQNRTRYVCDVSVKDHETGQTQALEVHIDESTGAMFALDATYVDQVTDEVVSPYGGAGLKLDCPPERPDPAFNRVAVPEDDIRALESELHAARLELVESYHWASTNLAQLNKTGKASAMPSSSMDRLKARADSIDAVLGNLAARPEGKHAPSGQIVSVSGDVDDPDQDVVVEVYAFVQGGVLQSMTASVALNVKVVDFDVERGAGALSVEFPADHGGSAEVSLSDLCVQANPAACRALATAIEQAQVEAPRQQPRGG